METEAAFIGSTPSVEPREKLAHASHGAFGNLARTAFPKIEQNVHILPFQVRTRAMPI